MCEDDVLCLYCLYLLLFLRSLLACTVGLGERHVQDNAISNYRGDFY